MCLACAMINDEELWPAYREYLDKQGLAGFELTPLDPQAVPEAQLPQPKQPAPSTFTCDET